MIQPFDQPLVVVAFDEGHDDRAGLLETLKLKAQEQVPHVAGRSAIGFEPRTR